MSNKKWTQNDKFENLLDGWRNVYCLVIPSITTLLFFASYKFADIKIWESEYFSDTLSSTITFVSIIISFFGVLLTLLITVKEQSELIQFFLDSADKALFVKSIKRLIIFGLLTVIMAACLFLEDIMEEWLLIALLCITVFSLIKFTTLTYRFTNILLMLFICDKNKYKKKEGPKLTKEQTDELAERINTGI